jgi:hypothetical protein
MFTRFGPFNPALPHGDPSKAHDHASRSLRGNQLMARAAWDHLVQVAHSWDILFFPSQLPNRARCRYVVGIEAGPESFE